MSKSRLVDTNPYLHSAVKRRHMFSLTVLSSTHVEGTALQPEDLAVKKPRRAGSKAARKSLKSSGPLR
jgi:hypothetical protein